MDKQLNRYIDPLTDFGFKHLFGSEPDKEIMIEFLNALFEGEKHIVDLIYSPTEHGVSMVKKRKCFSISPAQEKTAKNSLLKCSEHPKSISKTGVYSICPDSLADK